MTELEQLEAINDEYLMHFKVYPDFKWLLIGCNDSIPEYVALVRKAVKDNVPLPEYDDRQE
jgi:hypothetical protein